MRLVAASRVDLVEVGLEAGEGIAGSPNVHDGVAVTVHEADMRKTVGLVDHHRVVREHLVVAADLALRQRENDRHRVHRRHSYSAQDPLTRADRTPSPGTRRRGTRFSLEVDRSRSVPRAPEDI